jgi:hypothetical protein
MDIKCYSVVIMFIAILISCSYAIIGTQLNQNQGFESSITFDVVSSRSQIGQWGIPFYAVNNGGMYQTNTVFYEGGNSVCVPRRISEDRAIAQWVDLSPYTNNNRIFTGGWICIPNATNAQSWYNGTGRQGYFDNRWSTGTGDDLSVGIVRMGTGQYASLPTWQPMLGDDIWMASGYVNLISAFHVDIRTGCPADDFDNHFVDDYHVWVDDQVTEYKAIDFQQPGILSMDTNPAAPGDADIFENSDPWVIKDNEENLYKMWYTAKNLSGILQICYATSTDGIHDWLKYGAVLSPDRTNPSYSYDSNRTYVPCVLKEIIGSTTTYKMWYGALGTWTVDRPTAPNANRTGYATSPDGINWTRQGVAVGLNTTLTQCFNFGSAFAGKVIKVGSTYKMWMHDDGARRIGYSESTDGLTWRQPWRALERNCLAGSGIVGDTHPTDTTQLIYCSPYYDAEAGIYHIWYTAATSRPHPYQINHAVSDDGIFWTKDPRNPVITYKTLDQWDYSPCRMCVIRDGNKYKMWYSVYGTYNGISTLRIAYTEGTVQSSPIQIAPAVISANIGNSYILTQSGGVAPVTWQNSNTTAVSIESTANNGRTAFIRTAALGSAIITAADFYGNSANASITVVSTGAPVYQENKLSLLQRREFVAELFE